MSKSYNVTVVSQNDQLGSYNVTVVSQNDQLGQNRPMSYSILIHDF